MISLISSGVQSVHAAMFSSTKEVIPRNAEEGAQVIDEETRRSAHNVAAMAAHEWVCVVN